MLDLGDESDVRKRNTAIRRRQVVQANAIRWIMSERNGRAWIRSLLQRCKINQSAFATNALVMAHSSGEQNIGYQVLAEITTPDIIDLYVQMLKEEGEADEQV